MLDDPPDPTGAPLRQPLGDLLAYLVLGIGLLAWHWLVAEMAATRESWRVYDLWRGVGVAMAAVACLLLGVAFKDRTGRAGRLAGPLLPLARAWRIPGDCDGCGPPPCCSRAWSCAQPAS